VTSVLALLLLATGPVDARPMVGPGGFDDDGAPRDVPDKIAVQRLLRAREFDALDDWLRDLQQEFEDDPRKERWPSAALRAFDVADPTVGPLLDEYVEAKPGSYMALAARGLYHNKAGWHARGGKWAYETPPANFRAMEAEHRVAFPDLDEALRIHPALTEVSRALISIGNANGLPHLWLRKIFDAAAARCPDCLGLRVSYMHTLRPRWGGSYPAMRAFAAESARKSRNPRVGALAGFVDWDRSIVLREKKDPEAALAACEKALEAGEHWEFLDQRADLLIRLKRYDEAWKDVERADALSPQTVDILETRHTVLAHRRDYQAIARDTVALQALDPIKTRKDGDAKYAAQGLAYEAGQAREAGNLVRAIALLKRSVAMDPDDFDNHVRLDRLYSNSGQLPAALALWNGYLRRHPQEGKARLERGGTLWHLGRKPEALAEAARACRLGEQEGCDLVQRHGGEK
jgi:tetratricopeptide (TPR) repeat protein